MASKAGVVAGKAFVILEAIDGTAGALRSVERNLMSWGSRLQSIGARIFARGLTAMVPSALGTNVFKQFDDIMRRVQARTQGSAQEMQTLRNQAIGLGRDSAFSAREVAGLQDVLAQRKFNRTQIAEMTPPILQLGRAAGSGDNPAQDLLNSADLVSQAIMMYELEAKDAARVSDIFTAAANESNFALEDLIISMANGGPVAHQYGLSLEKTLAIMMVMRDLSIDSSVAGTGLRNLFLKASDKKAVGDFNKLMFEMTGNMLRFEDDMGNLFDPASILFSFDKLTKELGTAQRGHLLAELFGLRAITPATAVAANAVNFTDALAAVTNSAGETQRAYETMEDGIGGVFRRLLNIVEGIGLEIGKALERPVIAIGRRLHSLALQFIGWISINQRTVVSVTMLTAAVTSLAGMVFVLGTGVKILAVALRPLIATLSALYVLLNFTRIGVGFLVSTFFQLASAIVTAVISSLVALGPILVTIGAITLQVAGQILLAIIAVTGAMFALASAAVAVVVPAIMRLIFLFSALGTIVIVEVTRAMFGVALAIANVAYSIMTGVLGMSVATSMFIANLIAQGILLLAQFGVAIAISAAVAGILVGAWYLLKDALSSSNDEIEQMTTKVSQTGSVWQSTLETITGLWGRFMASVSASVDFIVSRFMEMGSVVFQTMKGMTDAMMAGDIDLAWEIIIAGMHVLWAQLLDFFLDSWLKIIKEVKGEWIKFQMWMGEMDAEWNPFHNPEDSLDKFNKLNAELKKNDNTITIKQQQDNWKREVDIRNKWKNLNDLTGYAARKKAWADAIGFESMNNPAMQSVLAVNPIQDLIQNGAPTGGIGGASAINAAQGYTTEGARTAYENSQNRIEQLQNQELKALQNIETELQDANEVLNDIKNKPPGFGGV